MAVLCPTHSSSQADSATRCHLGFSCLASSFPAPQGLELSLPAKTADPWKIRDTLSPLLFGDHFPMEPRVATVLLATSGEPGPTSAHFTLPRTDGNQDHRLCASAASHTVRALAGKGTESERGCSLDICTDL